jgi:putative tricarboxylic transport membrane protein
VGFWEHLWLGVLAVFGAAPAFALFGLPVSITLVMIAGGFALGILVGATPGLAGPMAMAIALPILISVFGVSADALLPVLGFLIGIMKGATIGGAVPAILFNTPGTPDALLTTFDGYPMAKRGQAGKALKAAHFASASGDTFSDLVLFTSAPFLAIMVERFLDLPEKTGLIILSLSFIAAIVGRSPAKGLISAGLGLLVAYVGKGEDFYPRLSLGQAALSDGFPVVTAVLGVLILGEVFKSLEDLIRNGPQAQNPKQSSAASDNRFGWAEIRSCLPYIHTSALIGTAIGALPGIGSTLAATLGYASGRRAWAKRNPDAPKFGSGRIEGVAATEAANSAVSGANLIPVLSLGIPGNAAAVFLILAMDSIGGFNPGPSVFKLQGGVTGGNINPELVIVFGIFTAMMLANALNWTLGGLFMRGVGFMAYIPKHLLLPVIFLLTMTAIYVQHTSMAAIYFAMGFGALGYLMRRIDMSVLPFVIAFILGRNLEDTARQAFAVTGGDPLFLLHSPIALAFVVASLVVVALAFWQASKPGAEG